MLKKTRTFLTRNQKSTILLLTFFSLGFFFCSEAKNKAIPLNQGKWSQAIFAGGCFWCMEPPFDKLDGVKATISGYIGGSEKHPSYKQVAYGLTGHTEAVMVLYDASKVSYEKLLYVFWRNINPTQVNGQFVDRGTQYRTGIFYLNEKQKKAAQKSKQELVDSKKFNKPIVTEITRATTFWKAEEYHQNFYKKDPAHYYRYRKGSGRDAYLERTWGK